MNKTVRDILLFAAGFGAGALVMHTVFEKKYETYYGKKYEAERENLRQKEADMDKTIEERATQKSFEQLAGKYRTESDPEDVVNMSPSKSLSRISLVSWTTTRLPF